VCDTGAQVSILNVNTVLQLSIRPNDKLMLMTYINDVVDTVGLVLT
jgi:hypothetical protein